MGAISSKLRSSVDGSGRRGLTYWCQGCNDLHQVWVQGGPPGSNWGWNGNVDAPTFTPSVLVRNGHHAGHHKPGDSCWCTYNAEQEAKGEKPSSFTCGVCHTYVTNGMVQFLGDCTHALAGKTEPLPDLPAHLRG